MDDRLVEFSNLLRRNGVRVSLAETIDAFRALGLLGIGDRANFREALRTTLVKRSIDIPTFNELFDLFFLGLGESFRESDRRIMAQMGLSPREFQELLEEIREFLDRFQENLSALARALLSGDTALVERLLREAGLRESIDQIRYGAEIGAYFQRVALQLGLDTVREDMEGFKARAALMGLSDEALERIAQYADRRLQDLVRMIREIVHRELKKNDVSSWDRDRLEYLYEKSFSYYTEEDIRKMNEVVAQLARRFKNLLSVKRKRARKGRFDVKDTLRKNLQYGGVPFRIRLHRRRKEKPQVVILCDISDSVLNASRFMLQFVYSIQELYDKVRSFVFVSDIGEATRLFEENEIHQAVDMALRGEIINVFSHSNFGRAFKIFHDQHGAAVTGKTTFLVIGDGRNNYHSPNEWVLREIQLKAKQVIWLNPESRLTWGIGDSEMPRYTPYCDVVEECRNINQLHKVIDRIVP